VDRRRASGTRVTLRAEHGVRGYRPVEVAIGRRPIRRAAATGVALLATALAPATSAAQPGADWQKVAPAAVGLDAARLNEIAAEARGGRSNCLVVVRDGKLAGEWYFRGTGPNTTQDVFSATKSVASTLVGIAQDDGDLRIGERASRWIPQWRGTESATVTVRNLLSMDSGREWSPLTDYLRLLPAPDRTAFAIGLGQAAAPGTVWAYNNSAVQTLDRVLARATGEDVAAFAERRVFEPLGMAHTSLGTDRAGNPQLFEGLQSTCRDLARFGLLMLDQGRWGNRQIVSSAWVKAATGRPSTKLNAAYGYLWWLNREGVIPSLTAATSLREVKSARVGRLVPGAPASMYWALGLGNQLIQIDPGSRTVVVRLGAATPNLLYRSFGPTTASRVVTTALAGGA
jgi:CubicO group peptidase (beta-lactamase class C family)